MSAPSPGEGSSVQYPEPPAVGDVAAPEVTGKPSSLLNYFGGRSLAPRPAPEEAPAPPTKTRTRGRKHDPKQKVLFAGSPAPSVASDASIASTAAAAGPSAWQLGVQEPAAKPARARKRTKPDEEQEIREMANVAKEQKNSTRKPRKSINISEAGDEPGEALAEGNGGIEADVPSSPRRIERGSKRQKAAETTPKSKRSQRNPRAASADGDLSSPRPVRTTRSRQVGPSISMTDLSDGDGEIEYAGTKHFVTELEDDGDESEKAAEQAQQKPKKKVYLVNSNRKAHPFFGGPPAAATPPVEQQHQQTMVYPAAPAPNPAAGPLELALRALQGRQTSLRDESSAPKPPVHDFFQAKNTAPIQTGLDNTETGWGRNASSPSAARWPCAEDAHVEANEPDDSPFEVEKPPLPRRQRLRSEDADAHGTIWTRYAKGHGFSSPAVSSALITPLAAASADSGGRRNVDNQLWMDKYRPRRAQDVLENEGEATYLRDWLKRLEIAPARTAVSTETAATRTEIQRKVVKAKRQRADQYDSWIVNDSDPIAEFGSSPAPSVGEPDIGQARAAMPAPALSADGYPALDQRLCNSILLSGPTGCGKTAAVYAVAAELDWDVFEVYPGIGKRSGLNLSFLVGDVSKNHTVVKGNAGSKGTSGEGKAKDILAKQKFFGGKQARTSTTVDLTGETDKQDKPKKVQDDKGLTGGRQSVILLEEVDVLFEEDKGFWQAVVALIADSRRPVVLTCNDDSLIPRSDLALQTTLLFEAPSKQAVGSRLNVIAESERRPISKQALDIILHSSQTKKHDPLPPDKALPPGLHPIFEGIDLRHAINQLQTAGQANPPPASKEKPAPPQQQSNGSMTSTPRQSAVLEPTLSSMQGVVERWSRADLCGGVSSSWLVEMNEIDRYAPSNDDEVGLNLLVKPSWPNAPVIALNSCEHDIEEACFQYAFGRAGSEQQRLGAMRQADVAARRMRHVRATLPILDALLPLDAPLLPHPALFLDYWPALVNMVAIDDRLEAEDRMAAAAGIERVNRHTGRAMRLTSLAGKTVAYERQLAGDLDARELQAIRQNSFDRLE